MLAILHSVMIHVRRLDRRERQDAGARAARAQRCDAGRRDRDPRRIAGGKAGRRVRLVQTTGIGAGSGRRSGGGSVMKSFTDLFIRHPVLAVVVNLAIVLVGWRSLATLTVPTYPTTQRPSLVLNTVHHR